MTDKALTPEQALYIADLIKSDPSIAVNDVAVGDLSSTARGSGARKNAGKPEYHQLPWWVVVELKVKTDTSAGSLPNVIQAAIASMGTWQRGEGAGLEWAAGHVWTALALEQGNDTISYLELVPVVRVLEFGAKKYAKGNWAKGMKWSVCFDCTMSHLTKAQAGLKNDDESGISHLAHALCNILFLLAYRDLYPEGDDRLPEFRVGGVDGTRD